MKKSHYLLWSALAMAQAQAYQLPYPPLRAYDCESCATLSHVPLADHWITTHAAMHTPVSNQQKSYSYTKKITAKQLLQGINLNTTGPSAILRVTPLQNKPLPTFYLSRGQQQKMPLKNAASLYSDNETLSSAFPTSPHQLLMQLNADLGSGQLQLQAENVADNDAFLIHVFDKNSPLYLQLATQHLRYQYGDQVTTTINLADEKSTYYIEDIHATLRGPNGEMLPMIVHEDANNQFTASAEINSPLNPHGANWDIQVDITTNFDDVLVTRTGHTSLSYFIPSAAITNIKKINSEPLTFAATVDIATGSRYGLQAVLATKTGKPITTLELAQTGQWLEPGTHLIEFSFDNTQHLKEDQLYLGNLSLLDYGQLKPVYGYEPFLKLSQLVD